ncbi:hypothetical protein H0H81_009458, partial [Sphagnurus paluster]
DIFVKLEIREHFNIPKLHSMVHYVDSIEALGSLDGYNSESPERLHIDFAKEAYRASNKRDYTEQMVMWLQRQEAMWTRGAFCAWVKDQQGLIDGERNNSGSESLSEESESESGAVPIPTPTSSAPLYAIAKKAPFKNVTVQCLTADFGAVDFIPALTTFLRGNIPDINMFPHEFD